MLRLSASVAPSAAVLLLLSATGVRGAEGGLEIVSTAFEPGAIIPRQYTCQGVDTSPGLNWSGLPAGTRTVVLIVDDPDAPDPAEPKVTWVHWLLWARPSW